MTKQKLNLLVGSIGAFLGIFVFVAYIPQIYANLQGSKAQPFQPLFAAISCLIWVIYGWTKEPKKDWILIIPNSAGVILGGINLSYCFVTLYNEYTSRQIFLRGLPVFFMDIVGLQYMILHHN